MATTIGEYCNQLLFAVNTQKLLDFAVELLIRYPVTHHRITRRSWLCQLTAVNWRDLTNSNVQKSMTRVRTLSTTQLVIGAIAILALVGILYSAFPHGS